MTASPTPSPSPAAAAGTVTIGGEHEVNRLGFGAMRITGPGIWGPPRDHDESLRVLRRAVELGVNFIDTADSYGPDVSEELIAEALAPYPEGLVIATKGGLVRPGRRPVGPRRPARAPARAALEGSLRRLRTEQVTLYQFHRPDPAVPLEESVGELARLRDEGKIRHVGLSNVSTGQLARARAIVPIVSVQNRYNPGDRASDEVVARGRARRLRLHPVGAGGRAPARRGPGAGRGGGAPRRLARAGGAGLAAGPLAADAAHPRHLVGGAPGGERGRRRARPRRGRHELAWPRDLHPRGVTTAPPVKATVRPSTDRSRQLSMSFQYEVRVRGRLSRTLASEFEELALAARVAPVETVLSGPIEDQAALHGLLRRIESLGLELLEVRRLPAEEPG